MTNEAAAAAALPLLVVQAPSHWQCIDFISDLHLDATRPNTFKAWIEYLKHSPAQAVFMLGDLFEAWVGDDAAQQAGSFEAQASAVLREASVRCWLGFMPGNRDFLVGPTLLENCGVQALSDPTVLCAFGQRVLLTHGDALCVDDKEYQRFRTQVRNPAWQSAFLNRPLNERRSLAQAMREASREHQHDPAAWADVDADTAVAWLETARCNVLVHGHTHRPGTQPLDARFKRHVLADWELDGAVTPRAQALRWRPAGFQRIDLSQ